MSCENKFDTSADAGPLIPIPTRPQIRMVRRPFGWALVRGSAPNVDIAHLIDADHARRTGRMLAEMEGAEFVDSAEGA